MTSTASTSFVSYIRVSTARQGQSGLGLEAQQKAISDFISSQGGVLVDVFKDVESGKHNERKGLQAALECCKAQGATLVIAKLDRLSRNAGFLFNLRDSGCKFVALDCPNANTLTIGVMASLAQQERELISARTKAALAAKKERGEVLKGNRINAFGDNNGALGRKQNKQNADDRAEKLRLTLMGLKAQGLSLHAIADELNKLNIPTARGGKWYAKSVSNYLKRLEA